MNNSVSDESASDSTDGVTVTVGVPVYNGDALLARAIDSALSQSDVDVRVVISDNGSSDETEAICRRYAARDPRVEVNRVDFNRGMAWNFNHLLGLATSKYVCWLAHDDVLRPGFLAAAVDRMERDENIACCYSITQPIDADGRAVGEPYAGWEVLESTARGRVRSVMRDWRIAAATYGVFRREMAARTRGVQPMLASDLVFVAELALRGTIVQIPDVLQLKHVPESPELYHSPASMLEYLGAPGRRSRIIGARARVVASVARAVLESGLRPSTVLRVVPELAFVYVRHGHASIDVREGLQAVLPSRITRLLQRRPWRTA